jgi:hypothetical protein
MADGLLRAGGDPQKMLVGASPATCTLGSTFGSDASNIEGGAAVAGDSNPSPHLAWAHLRFSVVGPLLSAPPARGALTAAIEALSRKTWRHPVTGEPMRFSARTIERWYYKARSAQRDPVAALRKAIRSDAGRQTALGTAFVERLLEQYQQHPHWSVKLHVDNLRVQVDDTPSLGPMPGYSTVPAPCSRPGGDGSSRCCWASSTTARVWSATPSGTGPRRRRTWCTA